MKRPRSGAGKPLPMATLNRRKREAGGAQFPALLRQDAGGIVSEGYLGRRTGDSLEDLSF